MADDDREHAIAAIVEAGRAARPPARLPRWLWLAALVVGLGCAVAFVIALVAGGDAGSEPPPVAGGGTHRFGFASGLALGIGAGIALGFTIGRQRGRDDVSGDHSPRNRP